MPTRLIRDGILTSERVNALSERGELFYRRLLNVADDYGRFSANLTLLRSTCYPLKVDSVKEDSIKKHLAEAVDAGLIVLYTVGAKEYLEIQDFGQRIQSKSKHPGPLDSPDLPVSPGVQPESTVENGDPPGKTALVGGVVGVEGGGGKRARDPAGARLPADFDPGEEGRQYARKHGLNPDAVMEAFRDYWTAAPGSRGRKSDWQATWRTWCRKDAEQRGGKAGAAAPRKRVDL